MDVWNESVLIFKYQLPVDGNLIRPTNIIFKKISFKYCLFLCLKCFILTSPAHKNTAMYECQKQDI